MVHGHQQTVVPAGDNQAPSMISLVRRTSSGGIPGLTKIRTAAMPASLPAGDGDAAAGGDPRIGAYSAQSTPLPGSTQQRLGPSPSKRAERVHGDHEDPQNFYPVPRFPPAHTSAAFEAMAVRKSLILTPPEIYAECAHHGEEKSKFGWLKLLVLSTIAGCYVGFGYTICLMVGGNLGADIYASRPGLFSLVFGAFGFPAAFTMIVVCGAELFTSMCAYMTAAWWEGKVTLTACFRMWIVTWFGNFAGCAIFVGLIYSTEMYEGKDWYALLLAQKKVHHGFGNTLVRGIYANWLVGVATWQANAAQDMMGKVAAIWLPISAFAMLGFEHVIANQFLLPMAIALGAPVTAYDVVVKNFIPATIGNWLGGAVCVATVYAFAYGTPNKRVHDSIAAWMDAWRARRRTAGMGGSNGGPDAVASMARTPSLKARRVPTMGRRSIGHA